MLNDKLKMVTLKNLLIELEAEAKERCCAIMEYCSGVCINSCEYSFLLCNRRSIRMLINGLEKYMKKE